MFSPQQILFQTKAIMTPTLRSSKENAHGSNNNCNIKAKILELVDLLDEYQQGYDDGTKKLQQDNDKLKNEIKEIVTQKKELEKDNDKFKKEITGKSDEIKRLKRTNGELEKAMAHLKTLKEEFEQFLKQKTHDHRQAIMAQTVEIAAKKKAEERAQQFQTSFHQLENECTQKQFIIDLQTKEINDLKANLATMTQQLMTQTQAERPPFSPL